MLCQKNLHEGCRMGRCIVVMTVICLLGHCECTVRSPLTGCQVTSWPRDWSWRYSKWTDTFWTALICPMWETFCFVAIKPGTKQSPVIPSKIYGSCVVFVTTESGTQNVKDIGARVLKLLYCAGHLSAVGWGREGTRWASPRDKDWCPDTKDQFGLGTRNSFCEVTQLSVCGDATIWCRDLWRWNWWRRDIGWGGTGQVLLRVVDKVLYPLTKLFWSGVSQILSD